MPGSRGVVEEKGRGGGGGGGGGMLIKRHRRTGQPLTVGLSTARTVEATSWVLLPLDPALQKAPTTHLDN